MFTLIKDRYGNLETFALTKSDSCSFVVEVLDSITNQEVQLQDVKEAHFIVKKFNSDKIALVDIVGKVNQVDGLIIFALKGTDTINMEIGDYLCSVVLLMDNGEKYTIVSPSCDNNNRYISNMKLCLSLDSISSDIQPNPSISYNRNCNNNNNMIKGILTYPTSISINSSYDECCMPEDISGGSVNRLNDLDVIDGGNYDSKFLNTLNSR